LQDPLHLLLVAYLHAAFSTLHAPVSTLSSPASNAPLVIVAAPDFTSDEVVIHAGSLLRDHEHALAAALAGYAQQHAIALLPAVHVDVLPAQGMLGRVNGKICVLGGPELLAQAGIDASGLESEAGMLRERGMTVCFLSIG